MAKLQRNLVVSYTAGILVQQQKPHKAFSMNKYTHITKFSIGWWILIDANAITNKWQMTDGSMNGIHYWPAIAGTLSLILLNAVSAEAMDFSGDDAFTSGENVGPKVTVFIAFCMAFGSLFGACYIFADKYMIHSPQPPAALITANIDGQNGQLFVKYPGIAVLLQNFMIFGRYVCVIMQHKD